MNNFLNIKIVFMGTPAIAASLLERLLQEGFTVIAVIAQPDAPVGRRGEIVPVPTKIVARNHGIPVIQPESMKADYGFINDFHCDLVVTLAYGQIVPNAVLAWPRLGCLNVHGSLLPALRGAAPMQYALINGLTTTGFTLMGMAEKMDAGPIYAQVKVPILDNDDYGTLASRMSEAINENIPKLLNDYIYGKFPAIAQDESQATFAYSIKPAQERLDINLPIVKFGSYVRGLAPEPGAYILDGEIKVKILSGTTYDELVASELGTVTLEGGKLLLQLIDGRYAIETLQWPGKRIMGYRDFINGNRHVLGHIWR